VAARANSHFKISKAAIKGGKKVATRVAQLEAGARQEEIARMLSGATITDEARAAARRLMENS
jgi:DNA repair protein RecN (Recombination protein N)